MTLTKTAPTRTARPDLTFAYLMTAIALACIWFSYLPASSPAFSMTTSTARQ